MNSVHKAINVLLLFTLSVQAAILPPQSQTGSQTASGVALDPVQAALTLASQGDDNPVATAMDQAADVVDTIADAASDAQDTVADAVSNVQDKISDVQETVKEKVSEARENVQENVENAKDKVDELKENIQEAVSDAVETMTEGQTGAVDDIGDVIEDTLTSSEEDLMSVDETPEVFEDVADETENLTDLLSEDASIDEDSDNENDASKESVADMIDEMIGDNELPGSEGFSSVLENVADQLTESREDESRETSDGEHDMANIFNVFRQFNGGAFTNGADANGAALSNMSRMRNFFDALEATRAKVAAAQTGTCPQYTVKVSGDRISIPTGNGCTIEIKLKGMQVDGSYAQDEDSNEVEREVSVSYTRDTDSK